MPACCEPRLICSRRCTAVAIVAGRLACAAETFGASFFPVRTDIQGNISVRISHDCFSCICCGPLHNFARSLVIKAGSPASSLFRVKAWLARTLISGICRATVARQWLQRLLEKFESNEDSFQKLKSIPLSEKAANEHAGTYSCTRGLLWLCRCSPLSLYALVQMRPVARFAAVHNGVGDNCNAHDALFRVPPIVQGNEVCSSIVRKPTEREHRELQGRRRCSVRGHSAAVPRLFDLHRFSGVCMLPAKTM